MTEAPDDEPSTGTAGRVAVLLAVLLVAAVLAWWLWPTRRGEPELAHRVLIVGGTPTDLVAAIAEAGFEGEQRTWAQTEADVRELTGSFDRDALLGYADEHGYGFVAVMLGDDYPWTETALGSEVPSDADAAVLCVGELCLDGQPRVQFGALPAGLDYLPALRRGEALRLALYEHPDLVRLWEQPTPEQMQQHLQLGKLADATALLKSSRARYELSADAWPKRWPKDAITRPWTAVRGFPVPGGLALQRTPLRLAVDEQRKVEVAEGEPEFVFVPMPAPRDRDPFGDAKPLAIPPVVQGLSSNNQRWLIGADAERGDVHRWELISGTLHDRGPVELPETAQVQLSDSGALAWTSDEGVDSELGPLHFQELEPVDFRWHDGDTLVLSLFNPNSAASRPAHSVGGPSGRSDSDLRFADGKGFDHSLALLLFARPHADPGAPELLALSLEELLVEHGGSVEPLGIHPTSTAGTFVVVRHQTAAGLVVESLIRVALPSTALRSTKTIDRASIRAAIRPIAALREQDGAALELLGVLPPFEQLEIAPDGSWVAWRSLDRPGSLHAARIKDGHLGAPVMLEPNSPQVQHPRFLADSSAIVFVAEQPWLFGVVPFVRVVARID